MRLPRALLLAWLAVIATVTLSGAPDQVGRIAETPWYCVTCGDAGATDVILNLLLFLPLGMLARVSGWTLRRTLLALALLTIAIELAQAFLLAGRDASLSDVLANAMGGAAGWLLFPTLEQALRPTPAQALRAATLLLVLSSVVWIATGVGLRVSLSSDGPWVGQPLRTWPGHDPFPGTMQRAEFDGITVENDPLGAMPARLDSLDLVLWLTRTDSTVTSRPISLLRVVDGRRQLQLSATIRGGDLLLEHRVAASNLLLRTPTWRFDDAALTPAGVPWQFHWLRMRDRIVLQSGPVSGPATETLVPLSVALGWAFVHPFAPPVGESAPWWTLLWIACWIGPLGWFAGHLWGRRTLIFGGLAVGAMMLASILSGVPYHVDELLGVAIIFASTALYGGTRWRREHRTPE